MIEYFSGGVDTFVMVAGIMTVTDVSGSVVIAVAGSVFIVDLVVNTHLFIYLSVYFFFPSVGFGALGVVLVTRVVVYTVFYCWFFKCYSLCYKFCLSGCLLCFNCRL